MTYAIVEASGTQIKVQPGYFYDLNRLHVDEEGNYTFDKVLLINNDGEVTVGQPYIEGATVQGTIQRHLRGRKVIVYKMRPKKNYRKKRGHRQELTRVMINSISVNGSVIAEAESTDAEAVTPEVVETVSE
ncbi:50S ribosomal protein L21 [Dactylococcopsis salina]|uniref:Large ribosomal subunit protein bL21 n=1 Tax=Dactylococcopsis salina (strain PCC 8305) TaxID=13035 RepID=K9YZ47_DACS8|nr:50S ribosomal protein L21 [Dactylococcopsis salina]AFZ51605.1 ribosomal protein L21 [Dactylococcopsis salina PCC 8305]